MFRNAQLATKGNNTDTSAFSAPEWPDTENFPGAGPDERAGTVGAFGGQRAGGRERGGDAGGERGAAAGTRGGDAEGHGTNPRPVSVYRGTSLIRKRPPHLGSP